MLCCALLFFLRMRFCVASQEERILYVRPGASREARRKHREALAAGCESLLLHHAAGCIFAPRGAKRKRRSKSPSSTSIRCPSIEGAKTSVWLRDEEQGKGVE
jgi:hypothetical protein